MYGTINAVGVVGVEAKSALQKLLNRSGASPLQQRWIIRLVTALALVLSVSLLLTVFTGAPTLPPAAPVKLRIQVRTLLWPATVAADVTSSFQDLPPTGPVLMTADLYNYTDADAPYWEESVKDYRARISSMNVRPNTIVRLN